MPKEPVALPINLIAVVKPLILVQCKNDWILGLGVKILTFIRYATNDFYMYIANCI